MEYIGIVNKIKKEHKSGIYGRSPIKNEMLKKIAKSKELEKALDVLFFSQKLTNKLVGKLTGVGTSGKWIKNNSEITFQKAIETDRKCLIFENESLDDNYSVKDCSYFYGLFDNFSNSEGVFRKMMQSKGGSIFAIYEKGNLPDNFKHIGNGHFSEGIYSKHPKNEDILIPLEKKSTKLINSIILEEIIRAYGALGAKKITITDITSHNAGVGATVKKISVGLGFSKEKKILKEEIFGEGTFSPERALADKYFIQDIPAVMTTIEGRINGNQLIKKFEESIDIGGGLDIGVLKVFGAEANYNYNRKWSFDVEFYDKNEIS